MSNPMIRSHTGNMVEARPTMRALWKTDAHKDTSGTLEYEAEVESIDGEYLYLKGIGRVPADECTMLFCPFAVWDELQRQDKDTGDWESIGCIVRSNSMYHITDRGAEVLIAGEDYVRHASPDLRPAEGYGV